MPFDDLSGFSEAYGREPVDVRPPIKLRKTIGQSVTFWGINALVMPLVSLVYLTISAEGLRSLMGVFGTRLYQTPIPGAGLLRQFDGANRLDIATLMALLLCGGVTLIWIRLFTFLFDSDRLRQAQQQNPVLFYLLATVIGIVLVGDTLIFYFGLSMKTSSSWTATPSFVPLLATVIYSAVLALIGCWHADYHASGKI